MRKKTQRDLFLCHSSEDKRNVVLPFTKILETHGVSYWFDQAEIKIGDSISTKIDEGLRDSHPDPPEGRGHLQDDQRDAGAGFLRED